MDAHIAIVGAGPLGGSIAHLLARLDVVTAVCLVDEAGQIAAGKALDISQAGAIEGFTTRVTGSNDFYTAAGASIVVVAERNDSVKTLQRIRQIARESVLVCAAPDDLPLVERAVRELHVPRTRILGSAPEALAAALRAFVALEANGSPEDVALTVLGVPPNQVIVPWEEATIAGRSLTRVLDEPALRRLEARTPALWPPGPLALAAATAKAVLAIVGRSTQLVSGFVAPDDSSGVRTRACALQVRLGQDGIVAIDLPALSGRDQTRLDNALLR